MSTTTPSMSDPLSQSLDSLVRQGTLSPDQADQLYSAAGARTPGGPGETPPSAGWSLPDRLRAGATAFGGALAFAALLVASVLSRGEFKGSVFAVMAVITVGLAIGAAAWYAVLPAVPHSRWTASVLGALAIKSVGFTILAPWGDKDAVTYLVGLGMIAAGVAGYWFLRGSAFAFAAFVGGFVLANQIWVNITSDDDGPLMYGVIMMFFGLLVAGAGWRFDCRNITGMLGGAVVLYGFLLVVYAGSAAGAAVAGFSRLSGDLGTTDSGLIGDGLPDYTDDIRVALILTLLLCAVLAALYAYTHYVGYLILAVIGLTQAPVVAILFLAREHPLRWSTILYGGIGGLIALAALVDQARRSGYALPTRTGGAPAGGPGGPPPGGPPPAGPPPAGPGGPPGGPPPASQPPDGPPSPPAGGTPPAPPSP